MGQSFGDVICPHCKAVQGESPADLLDGDCSATVECDTCKKKFFLEKDIIYTTSK